MGSASEIIELDWAEFGDAESVALRFHHTQGFIWLDSASQSHPDSRFHIISWRPKLQVVASQGLVHCEQHPIPKHLSSQPFKTLQWLTRQLLTEPLTPTHLPFMGGWLGYWSYDLGRYLEKLPVLAEADVAMPDMVQGWYEAALVLDIQSQKAFVCGFPSAVKRFLNELQKPKNLPDTPPFKLLSDWRSNMTAQSYAEKFQQVQEYLLSGDCYQVNLAQRHQASYLGSPIDAYLKLRKQNGGPFSAYMNTTDGQILSVSPERFLRCQNGKIETKPIKGTRPRRANPADDLAQQKELQNAPKDRAENLMIVDLLRNDLGRVAAAGTVKVPALFAIESFPAVHHLVSTVTAELAPEKSCFDLMAAAFPGGSITGAPKLRAMAIIEELEPHRRNIYCGSIGYISACGTMDTSITIRTLVCSQGKIYCQAGGGLVADSDCQSEYQETHDKVSQILPLLAEL